MKNTQFFQIEEGVYVNVMRVLQTYSLQPDPEMGRDWTFYYPLSWIVFTEIYD